MITDNKDPQGAANPIGYKVFANNFDVRKAPGTLMNTIDNTLCKNEIPDFPYAQK